MGQNSCSASIHSSTWVSCAYSAGDSTDNRVAPACDALRAAILAVGAVHLRHIHFPKDKAAASKVARSSISQVLDLVRQVIDAQTPTKPLENQDIEFIMAALLSCTIASVSVAHQSTSS